MSDVFNLMDWFEEEPKLVKDVSRETSGKSEISGHDKIRAIARKIQKTITRRGTEPKIASASSADEHKARLVTIRKKLAGKQQLMVIYLWQAKVWGYSYDHFLELIKEAKSIPWECLDPVAEEDYKRDLMWLEEEYTFFKDKELYEYADRIRSDILKIKGRFTGKSAIFQLNVGGGLDINSLNTSQVDAKIKQLEAELNVNGTTASVRETKGVESIKTPEAPTTTAD